MHVRCCFAVAAPFGMNVNRTVEVFNPLPTSAASRGPWAQSVFASLLSWPKRTLFKRESPLTHHLVSNSFNTLAEISEGGKNPISSQLCMTYQRFLFFKKGSFSLHTIISGEHIHSSPQRAVSSVPCIVFRRMWCVNVRVGCLVCGF